MVCIVEKSEEMTSGICGQTNSHTGFYVHALFHVHEMNKNSVRNMTNSTNNFFELMIVKNK